MNIITKFLDDRTCTRGFSADPVPDDNVKILLDTLNRIPCKESQIPTSVLVFGNNAMKEKREYFNKTHCPSKDPNDALIPNPQVLAPLVFLFYQKQPMIDGDGNTDKAIPKDRRKNYHYLFTGFSAMALTLCAQDLGLSVGYSQSHAIIKKPNNPMTDRKSPDFFQYNNKDLDIDFAVCIGYPVNWTKNKYQRIRQEPDEFKTITEWAKSSKEVGWERKISNGKPPPTYADFEAGALKQSNKEKSKRPELKTWVDLVGCNISLPQTWQND